MVKTVADRWAKWKEHKDKEEETLTLTESQRLAKKEELLQAESGRITEQGWKLIAIYEQMCESDRAKIQQLEADLRDKEEMIGRRDVMIARYKELVMRYQRGDASARSLSMDDI